MKCFAGTLASRLSVQAASRPALGQTRAMLERGTLRLVLPLFNQRRNGCLDQRTGQLGGVIDGGARRCGVGGLT